MSKICEYGGSDLLKCSKNAVNHIVYADESTLSLCAEHYDEWMTYYRRAAARGDDFSSEVIKLNR